MPCDGLEEWAAREGGSKGEEIGTHMADSRCFTADTNTASQPRAESRGGRLRDLRVSSGQGRSLLDVISNLATNPAMSHFVAIEIDPVSRRAIPQARRSTGTAGGEMLTELCMCRAGGEAAVKFSE